MKKSRFHPRLLTALCVLAAATPAVAGGFHEAFQPPDPPAQIPAIRAALLGYGYCTIAAARELDDGTSDIASVARKIAARCEAAYRTALVAETRHAISMAVLRNYDMAVEAVEMKRAGMLVSPP